MRHDIHGHEYHGARSREKRLLHQGSHIRREHWDFRFCGSGHFLYPFFGFSARKLRFFGFGVNCGLRIFRLLAFGFQYSSKILVGFRMWKSMMFSVFPNQVPVSLRSERQLCASAELEQSRNHFMLHLSQLHRFDQPEGFDN